MEPAQPVLSALEFFAAYSPEELAVLTGAMQRSEFAAGSVVFPEGAPGDSLCVVLSGAVEISTRISGDVERTLVTLLAGDVFGELSLLTGETRTATAKAREDSVMLTLDRAAFDRLWARQPLLCGKLLRHLLLVTARRVAATTDLYRRAVAWGIEISAVVELNYHELMTSHASLVVELSSGKVLRGVLLKVEKGPVGHELLLKTTDGQFAIVPYQAVTTISFARPEKV